MLADATMSLDNVVALAAITGGAFWLLAIGVLISIPIVAYGALILTALIRRAPEIIAVGAAFLGWIAGGMAVSDPLVASWVQADAPALAIIAHALVALFVFFAGKTANPNDARKVIRPGAFLDRPRTAPSPRQRFGRDPAAFETFGTRTSAAVFPAKRGLNRRPPAGFRAERDKPIHARLDGKESGRRRVRAARRYCGSDYFVASFCDSLA
jgi:hypothetical protein